MIFDANGNLYFADLEQNAIMKMDTTGAITKFVTGEKKIALVSIITYCIILTLESMKLAVQ
jgi:streptogramin lyase